MNKNNNKLFHQSSPVYWLSNLESRPLSLLGCEKPIIRNPLASAFIIFCLLVAPLPKAIAMDFLDALNSSLKQINKSLPRPPASAPHPTAVKPVPGHYPGSVHNKGKIQYQITYEGYSKDFVPIRNLIASGDFKRAYELEQQNIKENGIDFLNSVEAGLLSIDTQHTLDAIDDFASAETYLKQMMGRSIAEESFTQYGLEAMSLISGKGDLVEYIGEPYERILMLNYKSIAYLLNGERKAYNVTRRAIDWQNIERKEFEKNIGEIKKQVKENEKKPETEKASSYAPQAFDLIFNQYKRYQSKAKSIPSAYINPFGFYMAGIVQEFDSFEDASLRDNARISYKKALELNPRSKVIKRAIRATKRRRPPRNKRLVHVIVADGFAPEKKTLSFTLNIAGGLVPIKSPLFEPVKSSVKTIKIKSGRKVLATLSPIADIEAIILRNQLDKIPIEQARVMTAIARNIGENLLWNQLGGIGVIGKLFRESFANPDMRAWMTLPKKISAARFYVSKRLKKITIISYDKRGRRLAKKHVFLNRKSHNFIYARSIEKAIYAQVNKNLWIKKP